MRIKRNRTSESEVTTEIKLSAQEAEESFDAAYGTCSEMWGGVQITSVSGGGYLLAPENAPTSASEFEEHLIDTDELEDGEETDDFNIGPWLDLAASEEHLHFFRYNVGQGYETTSDLKKRFEVSVGDAEIELTYPPEKQAWAATLYIRGMIARGGVAEDTDELVMLCSGEMLPLMSRQHEIDPDLLFREWKREEMEAVRKYLLLLEEAQPDFS